MRRTALLLRRTPLRTSVGCRRTPYHADPVTPAVHDEVLRRDRAAMLRAGLTPSPVCIAPLVDPAQRGRCWGRTTEDHVKPEPRMGVRATSLARFLVSVCQGHMEDGRKAGYQWNTASRSLERAYLAEQYPEVAP